MLMTFVTCAEKTGLISKLCDGIFLTPFPVLEMQYLQNIRM